MIQARDARHMVVARDDHAYQAHPHIAAAADGSLLIVFNHAPRGAHILHPPHDPRYRNKLTRSFDQGRSWQAAEIVPGYDWSGVECSGLTLLPSGEIMLNQWRFHWVPLGFALNDSYPGAFQLPEDFAQEMIFSGELETGPKVIEKARALMPWARGKGRTFVHFSKDHGASFRETREIDTAPFSGGYGLRGARSLPDGRLIMPLNDIPDYQRIFVVTSADNGRSWGKPVLAAWSPPHLFTEPDLIVTDDGSLLLLFRDDHTGFLHSVRSHDAGETWSTPERTPIDSYPPHLLKLDDGRLLCTCGHRKPDFSIRGVISGDGGRSWTVRDTIVIRGGLPNKDLGYPSSVVLGDEIFTTYYCQDARGITGIEATRWRL